MKGSSVDIVSIFGNLEAIRYANEFKSVFIEAGWTVGEIDQKLDSSGNAFGIIVCVKDMSNPPKEATLIRNVLTSVGFNVGCSPNVLVPENGAWLVVGPKRTN